MIFVSAIVVAAGFNLRLKSKTSKPLIKIASKPVIFYSLKALSSHPLVKEIILVASPLNKEGLEQVIKSYKIRKIKQIVLGGRRRQDSVYNGLKQVSKAADFILIHDAARPFINKALISRVIKTAQQTGAAIAGMPVKATIKKVHSPQSVVHSGLVVEKTLDRNQLWEIQTPQIFKKDVILGAYKKFAKVDVTDDAMLVEKMGLKVAVVLGLENNIKITTPEDLTIAKAILKRG